MAQKYSVREINLSDKPGIYFIKNKENGKIYVGSSVNPKKRFYRHLRELKGNTHCNQHLQNAWNKYGESGFEIFVFCSVLNNNNLREVEKSLIKEFHACDREFGYNKSETTEFGTMTPEGRARLSLSMKGRKWSDEINKKKGRLGEQNGFYGKSHSRDTIMKIAKSRGIEPFFCIETGDIFYTYLEVTRIYKVRPATISECLKGKRYMSGGLHFALLSSIDSEKIFDNKVILLDCEKASMISKADPHRKLFKCVETGKLFTSVKVAAKENNTNRSSVSKNLNNTSSHAGGFHFKYIEPSTT